MTLAKETFAGRRQTYRVNLVGSVYKADDRSLVHGALHVTAVVFEGNSDTSGRNTALFVASLETRNTDRTANIATVEVVSGTYTVHMTVAC